MNRAALLVELINRIEATCDLLLEEGDARAAVLKDMVHALESEPSVADSPRARIIRALVRGAGIVEGRTGYPAARDANVYLVVDPIGEGTPTLLGRAERAVLAIQEERRSPARAMAEEYYGRDWVDQLAPLPRRFTLACSFTLTHFTMGSNHDVWAPPRPSVNLGGERWRCAICDEDLGDDVLDPPAVRSRDGSARPVCEQCAATGRRR